MRGLIVNKNEATFSKLLKQLNATHKDNLSFFYRWLNNFTISSFMRGV